MVGTVRYWDGNSWTEHRAPAQENALSTASDPVAAPAAAPLAPSTAVPNQAKRSKKKAIIWSVVAAVMVLTVVLGVSLKQGMDNNIANGVALADALTINDQEIAAVASAFATTDTGDGAIPDRSGDSSGMPTPDGFVTRDRCSAGQEQGGLAGLWIVTTSNEVHSKGDQWYFDTDCRFYTYEKKQYETPYDSGVWVQDGMGGDAYVTYCGAPWDSCMNTIEANPQRIFILRETNEDTLRKIQNVNYALALKRAPVGTERKTANPVSAPNDLHEANDQRTTAEELRSLSKSEDANVGCRVALNAKTPPQILSELADREYANEFGGKSKRAAGCVANNPNAPRALLENLLESPDRTVSSAAKRTLDELASNANTGD